MNRAYVDIANATNSRTIGIYPTNRPAITGDSYFVSGNQRQQSLRRVYNVTGTGNIAHGITLTQIAGFVKIYGTFTDGTNWYTLPYTDPVAANNQISLTVTPTNIVITAGGGTPPSIVSGWVVLDWISNP